MSAEHFRVVSINDESLQTERMTHEELMDYSTSREWSKIAPSIDPQRTLIFHVKEIPNALMDSYVMAVDSEPEQVRRAFLCGVVMVENLRDKDGTAKRWEPSGKLGDYTRMEASEAELFSYGERTEIGTVILYRSFFRRKTGLTFRLPRSLLVQSADYRFRPVDANPNSAATSSEKH